MSNSGQMACMVKWIPKSDASAFRNEASSAQGGPTLTGDGLSRDDAFNMKASSISEGAVLDS